MPHDIHSIAYTGAQPWHGLGNKLALNAPLEEWAHSAGMDWRICESPVSYQVEAAGQLGVYHGQKVLYRSDTQKALSIVSDNYHIVQPGEVLEFFRELVEVRGYVLDAAGCLRGGRRFWALAKMGELIDLPGGDLVEGYLLLATSCDGTIATSVIPTSIRVVCSNTLHATLQGAVGGIRVVHSRAFDAVKAKAKLDLAREQWDAYAQLIQRLTRKRISKAEATRYFQTVVADMQAHDSGNVQRKHAKSYDAMNRLYGGSAKGASLKSAEGTAWGLLNAVTEYVDHGRKTRSEDSRLTSAWFGRGAFLKQWALEQAEALL